MTATALQSKGGVKLGTFGVPDEFSAAACARLRSILPVLAGAYLLYAAAAAYLLRSGEVRLAGGVSALAAGAISLVLWLLIRADKVPMRMVHPAAAVVAGAVLANGWTGMPVSTWPTPATVVFLVVATSGVALYSLAWYWLIAGACLASWVAASWLLLPANDLAYWALILLCAAGLSGANLQYRLWKLRRKNKGVAFSSEYLEKAIAGTQDGLWYWELKSDVFHFSPAWAAMLGFEPRELAKSPEEWMSRVHPGYLERLHKELKTHLYGEAPHFRNEHRLRRKDGTYMWVLARGTVMRNGAGEPVILAGSHSDITPLIEVEKRLLTDTFKDQLTGLANRSFLMSHLGMALEERRKLGRQAPLFSVMFLDLDRFKFVNDTMGHHVGDELLMAVAGRLRNGARPDDLVARFGGDEFVVLLRNLAGPDEAMQVAHRMLTALMTPFQLGEHEVQSGGSIGLALSSERFKGAEEILRFGDIAMYQAKRGGKGQVKLFHPSMLEESNRQEELQRELENAVERGQLLLHYQPLFQMTTGRIVGAEALVRWRRASGELMYPAHFIPLAEKSGLIHAIGEWTLRTACARSAAWQRAGLPPVRVSVNLSARQLQQRDLPEIVQRVLAETNLRPEWLQLELTEIALMRSSEMAAGTLKRLGDSGIRTAIDNFGTGDSSLIHLRQFEFHTLKMDRKFVSEITTNSKTAAVARGLISMAHHMGISVVAEGVERKDQFQFLWAERCDHVQGYLTGKPVPEEELVEIMRSRQGTPPTSAGLQAMHAAAAGPNGSPVALRWAQERKLRQ
ncbi:MAG: EAL domain-containing protein [Acidobacteria bacterium]|nr:EAL domain-containing protein [Acidobacteriota bacterium]